MRTAKFLLLLMFALTSSFIKGAWAIEPLSALALSPTVNQYMAGEKVNLVTRYNTAYDAKENKPVNLIYSAEAARYKPYDGGWASAPKGSVAVIPVLDVIMKNDYCGAPGLQTLHKWMKEADDNQNIVGTLLYFDTPGGSVDYLKTFGEGILQLNKPVIGFIDGMCASAGIYIGSSCRELIANEPNDLVGSIGTMITLTDIREYEKMNGIKTIHIYADQSTRKNKIFQEALDGNTKALREKFLSPLAQDFIDTVKQNRKGRIINPPKELFEGEIYTANEAVKFGLIDAVGNIDYAISRVKFYSGV